MADVLRSFFVTAGPTLSGDLTAGYVGGPVLSPLTRVTTSAATGNPNVSISVLASVAATRSNHYFSDFYNRIWVYPSVINMGALGADTTEEFYIWNAYLTTKTMSNIVPVGNDGVSVSVVTPVVMPALRLYTYAATATLNGEMDIAARFTFNYAGGDAPTLDVIGSRGRLWPLPPDWKQSYRITHEYKTEIITSRSGKEQRRALRTTPRKTVEFRSMVQGDSFRTMKRLLASWQNKRMVMPEVTRSAVMVAPLALGTYSVELNEIPNWLVAGLRVVIQRHTNSFTMTQSIHKVASVNTGTKQVTFVTPAASLWAVGTSIHPALSGLMKADLSTSSVTSNVGTVAVKFEVDPTSEQFEPATTAGTIYDGREVFTMKPNWAGGVDTAYTHPVEEVDYGRGPIETLRPIAFGTTARRNEFLSLGRDDAESLLAQFRRTKGQRGEFWSESGEHDIVIKGVTLPGNYEIVTQGSELYSAFFDDTVHRALYFKMKSGTDYRVGVDEIYLNTEGDTVLRLHNFFPEAVSEALVVRVAWLKLSRHATDQLTFDWITDQVSRTQMTFRSLENLSAEVRS